MLSSSFKRVNKKHNNIKDQLIVLFMKNRLMFHDSDMMRSNEKSRRRDWTKQISVTTKGSKQISVTTKGSKQISVTTKGSKQRSLLQPKDLNRSLLQPKDLNRSLLQPKDLNRDLCYNQRI